MGGPSLSFFFFLTPELTFTPNLQVPFSGDDLSPLRLLFKNAGFF